MNKKFISLVIGFFILGALLVFQATRTSASAVLTPSELATHGSDSTIRQIRVGGRVANAQVDYQVEPSISLKFSITDPGSTAEENLIPVVYDGLKPDMFASGRDVIIDGEFRSGTLYAHTLLTQCPSKYEPPHPVNSAHTQSY